MKILFLGAHTDDIEHAAGATMSKEMEAGTSIIYRTFSRCLDLPRNAGLEHDQQNVQSYLTKRGVDVQMLDFTNRELQKHAAEIRLVLEKIRDTHDIDLVFTHDPNDLNQDHQTIYQESIRVFRNHSVLLYQCMRSSNKFQPNYFVEITEDLLNKKLELLNLFKTQASLYYNNKEVIRALAITRGAECGSQLAEAFQVFKLKR